jgi:hypothetical protein
MTETEGSSAVISTCGTYRYVLTRRIPQVMRWVKPCLFIMLNPSIADATQDDPTIRRCMGFSRSWGSLTVVNLFALRATDPADLEKAADPVGEFNDVHILRQADEHRLGVVVAAWGAHPFAKERQDQVLRIISGVVALKALGVTKGGSPKHPLYLPKSSAPFEYPVPHQVVLASPHLTPEGE